VKRFNVI